MYASVFLFYGENTYALRQELQRRKVNFLERYRQDALFYFSNQNRDLGMIKQALYAGGLFVSKKMVIIEGVPKDTSEGNTLSADKIEKFFEDFQQNIDKLPADTIVILLSNKPDKRTKPFKRCMDNLQLKNFEPYKEPQLKTLITSQLEPLKIGSEELSYFLLKIGDDPYRLVSEAEKLKYWLPPATSQITKEQIDEYCFGMVEGDSFAFFDQLFSDPVLAAQTLEKMKSDGENRNTANGLLTRGLKVYLTLLDYHQQGITSAKEIIAQTKLNPFVVHKNLKNISILLSYQDFIKNFFKQLIELEFAIKTWKYPESYYRLATKRILLSQHQK